MTRDEREPRLEQRLAKAEELAQAHPALREQRAELGEFSADVHDEAARAREERAALAQDQAAD